MTMCTYCHIGKLDLKRVPYAQWHENGLILVEYISAMVCDTCAEKTYNLESLDNLQRLLASRPIEKKDSLDNNMD
ncbi:MAG: hypothetical protein B6242_16470 [Anaerolineaceae bacterium 4572_78]|nr:MAG: hypothetical protein B6242_16470 [Anaerolineaceae bacterium 4572_78]